MESSMKESFLAMAGYFPATLFFSAGSSMIRYNCGSGEFPNSILVQCSIAGCSLGVKYFHPSLEILNVLFKF